MRKLSLHKISEQISECLNKFYDEKYEWQTMDNILEQACSELPSSELRFLIPKVILIDRYYKTNLIKFGDEVDEDGDSVHAFSYYKSIAAGLRQLDLDSRIENIQKKAAKLCTCNLEAVVKLCNDVSDVVKKSTGRAGIVFASKLLHFSAPGLFPILDSHAEEKLKDVFKELDDDANERIGEIRDSVNKVNKKALLDLPKPGAKYNAFATDILCLQYALCLNGDPFYTCRELDKYLYGSRYLLETSL